MKLTRRQLRCLALISYHAYAEAQDSETVRDYMALCRAGLAVDKSMGRYRCFCITPAGRAHVRKACEVTND